MAEWLSIEVFDGPFAVSRWQDAHGDALTEAAVSHGAKYWQWERHRARIPRRPRPRPAAGAAQLPVPVEAVPRLAIREAYT